MNNENIIELTDSKLITNILNKLKITILVLNMFILCLIGCKADKQNYPEYSVKVNSELGCAELLYEGVKYRPYGILKPFNKFIAKQIGIREDSANSKIYELKGYNSREWIVDYLDVLMPTNMIFKSID
ncbi:hypothetical protein, partial [Treponema sp. R80B11-R83G3]